MIASRLLVRPELQSNLAHRTEHDQTSGALQEVPPTSVDFSTCLDNDRATYSHVLTRNVFCAGGAQGASHLPRCQGKIIRVPLNGGPSLKIGEPKQLEGIDRNCAEGRGYWSNFTTHQILSMKYDGTDQKPFTTEDIGWPKGVGVDWITLNLYWVDSKKNTTEVASLENPNVRTLLIFKHIVDVRGIGVDPFGSKLYWLNCNDGKAKIEWSNLDGTERQMLAGSPQVALVYGLQVSMASGELCYADGRKATHKVEGIDPFSKQIRTIASNLTDPFGLAIRNELFYWSDKQNAEDR